MKNVILLVALLFTGAVMADELNYNVVSISAEAERDVPNDLMMVQLMVEHQDSSAAKVSQQVNQDMSWALKQLKGEKALKYETQQYSTYPMYDKHKIKGWQASQQLAIESEDFEKLSEVILVLQAKLQVKNMSFAPTKRTKKKVEDELVAEALSAFKKRAKLVQDNLDADGYKMVNVNVNTHGNYAPVYYSGRPSMKMRSMAMESAPAVEGGTSTMQVNVNGQIQLQ